MERIILVVSAEHDEPTSYLGTWSRKIIRELQTGASVRIVDLCGPAATKMNVLDAISRHDPSVIVFNGHGNDDRICGFQGDILIRTGDDLEKFSRRTIHAMACNSAAILGGEIVRIGGVAFIGYREEFKLVHQRRETDQEREADDVAAMILNPAFAAVSSLMNGEPPAKAYARSQHEYALGMAEIIRCDNDQLNSIVGARLYHNMRYQTCLEA